jgi:hypothetical protein
MTFRIEFSDKRFRLMIISGNGEEDYEEAVLYCSVSSVIAPNGKPYGVYLTGSETDLDALTNHPTDITMVSNSVKVYDLSSWPKLTLIDAPVTLLEAEYEDDEEEDDLEDEDETVIDVEPVA